MRLFLATGVLGGLTTFSAFSYETIGLALAGWNIAGNVLLGFAAAVLGIMTARLWV